MYRAVTWAALQDGLAPAPAAEAPTAAGSGGPAPAAEATTTAEGGDAAAEVALGALAERIDLRLDPTDGAVLVDGVDVGAAIRGPEVTAAVSAVSAVPAVRAVLRRRQREWAAREGGGVVEGRDVGTVVFPDAALKVFLTARPDVRAARRAAEVGGDVAAIAEEIVRRDRADSTRADSPLAQAADAVLLDTSDLTLDEVVERVCGEVRARTGMPGWRP
jgi:cytidylate kinase